MNKIIVGTWGLSGDFGNISLSITEKVLKYAYFKGIKEFDTAPSYGNGFMEFCLGKVFYGHKDITINTKVGNLPFYEKSFTINDMKKSVNESLKRLNGLPINILFLHNPRNEFIYTLEYLTYLKNSGTIKLIGLSRAKNYYYSNYFLNHFDIIQDDLNLLYLAPLQEELKTKFMARSPLASGLLTNNSKIYIPDDVRSEWLKDERLKSLLKRVTKIKEIIGNEDISSTARRFVINDKMVYKTIFGVKSITHIDDIIQDTKMPSLPSELIEKLINLYNNDFYLENEEKYKY